MESMELSMSEGCWADWIRVAIGFWVRGGVFEERIERREWTY